MYVTSNPTVERNQRAQPKQTNQVTVTSPFITIITLLTSLDQCSSINFTFYISLAQTTINSNGKKTTTSKPATKKTQPRNQVIVNYLYITFITILTLHYYSRITKCNHSIPGKENVSHKQLFRIRQ